MQWENDPHKNLKFDVFDLITKSLPHELTSKIKYNVLLTAINELFCYILPGEAYLPTNKKDDLN